MPQPASTAASQRQKYPDRKQKLHQRRRGLNRTHRRARRPGTGYIKQLKEDLWEGRYSPVWPDGKKHSRNVYGHTREECEEKLAKLILQMKAEIAVLRNGTAAEYPDGVSPKKKQLAEYLRQHPGVSNKSYIARKQAWTAPRCRNTTMRSEQNLPHRQTHKTKIRRW